MTAALLMALTLAGCGRKGGLDPPPAAALPGQPAVQRTADGQAAPPSAPGTRPVAAQPKHSGFFLDWLLN